MALEIIQSSRSKIAWSVKQRVILAVVGLVIGIVLFVIAYIGMRYNAGIGTYNQPILNFMISHRNSQITDIMKIITEMFDPIILTVAVCFVAVMWVMIKREIWRPILLISFTGIAAIMSTLIKTSTMNSRPSFTDMVAPFEVDYSFPSGHTICIVVFMLVISYLILSRHSSVVRIISWAVITIFGVGLVATSRLYLGYHWLTDVTASIGLGLMILTLAIVVDIVIGKYIKS